MDSKRVFFSLLERVGAAGKYQNVSLIIWSTIMLTVGASSFFNSFLFYQDDYLCPANIDANCKEYVCSLSISDRKQYINPFFSSLASSFGDYRCENREQLDNLQAFIYLGGLAGVVGGALLNRHISKRTLLIISLVMNIVGLGLSVIADKLIIAGIGLLINYAAKSIQIEMIPCFISQSVSQDKCGRQIMIIYLVFAFGVTLNGLFFKLITSWQLVLVIYLLVPCCLSLLGLLYFVQEAPFDLVIRNSPKHAYAAFKKIAEYNGTSQTHGITLDEITDIKQEYIENEHQRNQNSVTVSIIDLFRYKSLRTITIISSLLHFFISLQFAAPELALQDYSLDVYLNGIIIGFSQVIASSISYFIVDRFARKKIIVTTEVLALLVTVPIILFAAGKNSQTFSMQMLQTGGIFLFRFLSTIGYNFYYMMMYETFPTQVRGLAIQVTSFSAYVGVSIIPILLTFCEKIHVSIVFTFAISCLLIVGLIMQLPQTHNITAPDMIEELSYQHHEHSNLNAKLATS